MWNNPQPEQDAKLFGNNSTAPPRRHSRTSPAASYLYIVAFGTSNTQRPSRESNHRPPGGDSAAQTRVFVSKSPSWTFKANVLKKEGFEPATSCCCCCYHSQAPQLPPAVGQSGRRARLFSRRLTLSNEVVSATPGRDTRGRREVAAAAAAATLQKRTRHTRAAGAEQFIVK